MAASGSTGAMQGAGDTCGGSGTKRLILFRPAGSGEGGCWTSENGCLCMRPELGGVSKSNDSLEGSRPCDGAELGGASSAVTVAEDEDLGCERPP